MELDTIALSALIHLARKCETSRNLEPQIEVFRPFWDNFSTNPDVTGLSCEMQAEIYRLCGKFLCVYGHSKLLPDFQERGKDLLSAAAEMFEKLGNKDKASEARCQIAFSYYRDGRTDNSTAVLEYDLSNRSHLSVSQIVDIKINLLFVLIENGQFDLCRQILNYIKNVISKCEPRLKLPFLNVNGLYELHGAKNFVNAERWFDKAVRCAVSDNDHRAVAQALNNLANAYLAANNPHSALKAIDESIEITKKLDDRGALPSYYDTRANIELALGKKFKALRTIEKSIEGFNVSGEFCFHRESLQTKIKILLAIGDTSKALLTNSQLIELIRTERGETEAEKYATDFLLKVGDAEILEVASLTDLIIKNPVIADAEIIDCPNGCDVFFIPASKAGVLGFTVDIYAAVNPAENKNPVIMMLKDTGEYLIGDLLVERFKIDDEQCKMFFLSDEQDNHFPVSPSDAVIAGNVVAIAKASDLEDKVLYFEEI